MRLPLHQMRYVMLFRWMVASEHFHENSAPDDEDGADDLVALDAFSQIQACKDHGGDDGEIAEDGERGHGESVQRLVEARDVQKAGDEGETEQDAEEGEGDLPQFPADGHTRRECEDGRAADDCDHGAGEDDRGGVHVVEVFAEEEIAEAVEETGEEEKNISGKE